MSNVQNESPSKIELVANYSIHDFGNDLIFSKDLDPVYPMLVQANLPEPQLHSWLIAYWCYYHVGVASYLSEFDGDAYWSRMAEAAANQTRTPHVVPLSDAAMEIIEAQSQRRCSDVVFPGRFGSALATSTCAPALRRIGITNTTLHGFRSSFRDWASELGGIDDNVAELSLNHKVGNAVQQAYLRTTLFDKRKVAMAAYADWLARREPASNVVSFPSKATTA
jgi:hypothetical protein